MPASTRSCAQRRLRGRNGAQQRVVLERSDIGSCSSANQPIDAFHTPFAASRGQSTLRNSSTTFFIWAVPLFKEKINYDNDAIAGSIIQPRRVSSQFGVRIVQLFKSNWVLDHRIKHLVNCSQSLCWLDQVHSCNGARTFSRSMVQDKY